MGTSIKDNFAKGDVVVVPFPFSDLSSTKRRPALVIAVLTKNDLMLCQITSQDKSDRYATVIADDDFETGSLNKPSYAKADRIFTSNERIIAYKVGKLTNVKTGEIISKLIAILQEKL